MTIRRRVQTLCFCSLFLALCAALAGCQASESQTARDRTGGLSLEMTVRDEGNKAVLYRVEPDGTLSFGGGVSANIGKTTWSDQMTEAEIAELRSLLDQHRWFERDPGSTNDPPERRYRIQVSRAGQSRTFTVKGESTDVQPVHDLLSQVAHRRIEPDLNRLPQPSVEEQ